ncbi:MAG: hypothetical protein ACI9W4_000750 [Rhodothermales bacterium]|jgi:hypothetical protein
MDSGSNEGRTYNEKDIAKLIQRASEIHARAEGATERSLSLDEVGQIAADLGLPMLSLQEAALELEEDPKSGKRFSLTGAPFATSESRVASGVLTAEAWENMQLELQRYSRAEGSASEVGDARIWTHSVGEGPSGFNFEQTQVTVRPAEDHTKIQVRLNYEGAVVMYVMGFFFTSFITLLVAHSMQDVSKLAELAMAGAGGVSSLAVVRGLIGAGVRRQKDKLSRMADRLVQIVSRGEPAEVVATPVLSLDEDAIDPETARASGERSKIRS